MQLSGQDDEMTKHRCVSDKNVPTPCLTAFSDMISTDIVLTSDNYIFVREATKYEARMLFKVMTSSVSIRCSRAIKFVHFAMHHSLGLFSGTAKPSSG